MDERALKWMEEHNGDEWCQYCRFSDECGGGVIGGPNGPIFLPCADGGPEMCLDENAILGAMESENS